MRNENSREEKFIVIRALFEGDATNACQPVKVVISNTTQTCLFMWAYISAAVLAHLPSRWKSGW